MADKERSAEHDYPTCRICGEKGSSLCDKCKDRIQKRDT